ncbi:MAG: hypothetical protein AMXMBFR84_39710 [Candidatus Hydrogenedentota bacterium]
MKSNPGRPSPRPFLGVRFNCCGVYSRIYLNRTGTAFAGHCPRCAAPLTIKVGPGGSDSKFWVVE